jgi:hypothetical protein
VIVTIYRLYSQNGNRAGFWVQHRTWSNICGQVQSIAGHVQGALPGSAPLYDHASVLMRFFDVRSGRPIVVGPTTQNPSDKKFSQIAQPSWHSNHDLSAPATALAGDGDDFA